MTNQLLNQLTELNVQTFAGNRWESSNSELVKEVINSDTKELLSLLFRFGEVFFYKIFVLVEDKISELNIDDWKTILNSLQNEIEVKQFISFVYCIGKKDGLTFVKNNWEGNKKILKKAISLLSSKEKIEQISNYMRDIYDLKKVESSIIKI